MLKLSRYFQNTCSLLKSALSPSNQRIIPTFSTPGKGTHFCTGRGGGPPGRYNFRVAKPSCSHNHVAGRPLPLCLPLKTHTKTGPSSCDQETLCWPRKPRQRQQYIKRYKPIETTSNMASVCVCLPSENGPSSWPKRVRDNVYMVS